LADGGPDPVDSQDESITALAERLVDDVRGYAEAELGLWKAIVEYRAVRARQALVMLAIGWFLLLAAMTALVIGAMVWLTQLFGPLVAGLGVGMPLALGGYLLVRIGWAGIKGLGRDSHEQAAIERGKAAR
jgi:hypothetical protein